MGNVETDENFMLEGVKELTSVKKYLKGIQGTTEALCLMNQNGNILGCNLAFAQYIGLQDVQTVGLVVDHITKICAPEQLEGEDPTAKGINLKIGQALANPNFDFKWNILTLTNEIKLSQIWFQTVRLRVGLCIQVLIRIIQESDKIKEMSQTLINDQQVTPREIADFCIEESVRITHSKIGYIAFINKTQDKLYLYGWSTSAMKECTMINKPVEYELNKTGLWGEALRQRKAVITNDYENEKKYKKGTPQGHVVIKRHMNAPIFDDPKKKKRVVLITGVGNKEKEYTEKDINKIEELMNNMWAIFKKRWKI